LSSTFCSVIIPSTPEYVAMAASLLSLTRSGSHFLAMSLVLAKMWCAVRQDYSYL
jgi:hypothetical protein